MLLVQHVRKQSLVLIRIMITITISVTYTVSHTYLYFKLDLVHCAEYLGHLSSCIFTLSILFFAYFLHCQYFTLILKKNLFKSFDFINTTQNLHLYTNLKKQIRTHFRLQRTKRLIRTDLKHRTDS